MGISRLFLREILEICNLLSTEKKFLTNKKNILFLGDQSIRVSLKQILNLHSNKSVFQKGFKSLKKAKLHDLFPNFSQNDLIINTLDINGNPSIKADITNEEELIKASIKKESISQFIDIGTLEHVIDPHKAMCNISNLLTHRGLISHLSPCSSYLNHGYYCISPQLFNDFYLSKGYEILRFRTLSYFGNYDSIFSICFNIEYDHNAELEGLRKTLKKGKFKTLFNSLIRRILIRFCKETYISFSAKKIKRDISSDHRLYQKQYE